MPLLGNVVISKKILRTRKIMVMHSNERGECCPRTLVDRQRKPFKQRVLATVKPVSRKRTRNVGLGRFISQYR